MKNEDEEIKELRVLSREIDDLYASDDIDVKKGKKLLEKALEKALEKSVNNKAYHLFFQSEQAWYGNKDAKVTVKLCRQAVRKRPNDYFLLRSLGAAISGLESNKALRESIKYYKEAINLKEDALAYRDLAVSEFKLRNKKNALQAIEQAYKLAPDDMFIIEIYIHIHTFFESKEKESITPINKYKFIKMRALVEKVQDRFKSKSKQFIDAINESEENLEDFLGTESFLDKDISIFLVLRRWNSFTPTIPSDEDERSIGGGYFIYHQGKGTVIDPGYNFIENFYKAGCKIVDIDNIIITHAHNDHTIDFESIMTLLYKYNDINKTNKKINIYMNTGSMMKFSGIIALRGCGYIDRIYTMTAGNKYELNCTQGSMKLTVLPAHHDELVSKKYSVGLYFEIMTKEGVKRILLTSDTGLFPQMKNYDGKTVANVNDDEIHVRYKEHLGIKKDGSIEGINLLITHLGSIKKSELEGNLVKEPVFYPNHLGILGTVSMITAIMPELALVSEFGEELKSFRDELLGLLDGVVKDYCRKEANSTVPKVLPADIPFIYNIAKASVYCMVSEKFIPYKNISYVQYKHIFYYFKKDTIKKIQQISSKVQRVNSGRQGRSVPYFK